MTAEEFAVELAAFVHARVVTGLAIEDAAATVLGSALSLCASAEFSADDVRIMVEHILKPPQVQG